MRDGSGRHSTLTYALASLLLVKAIALLDWVTGSELSFSIFYLAPVAYAVTRAGRSLGIVVSVFGAFAWLIADLGAGHVYAAAFIPYWNAGVRLGFFLTVTLLLARLRDALRAEWALSRTDPLTGAANSRYFREVAAGEIDRAARYGHPLTLAYIDLDNFKHVNDTQGHSTGDAVLRTVAETVRIDLRTTDTLGRLGGDEFAILLPETPYGAAHASLQRLRERLLAEMRRNSWPVTFSIGAVTSAAPLGSVDEMIGRADALMYTVKHGSKNRMEHEALSSSSLASTRSPGVVASRREQGGGNGSTP